MNAPEDSEGGLPVPRRYSDREVSRILERAAELQRAEPSATNPEGLTLAELSEIAREAGIDPRLLQRAASELQGRTPAATLGARLAGAPFTIHIERTVEGELQSDRFDALIPRIQQATKGQGTASAVGRTLTWSSQTSDNTTSQQVLISSGDGRTLIRWEERFGSLAGALFGGFLGGGGVGLGVALGAIAGTAGPLVAGIALPALAIGGSYGLARTIYARIVRGRQAAALEVVDEIAAYIARAGMHESTGPAIGAAGQGGGEVPAPPRT